MANPGPKRGRLVPLDLLTGSDVGGTDPHHNKQRLQLLTDSWAPRRGTIAKRYGSTALAGTHAAEPNLGTLRGKLALLGDTLKVEEGGAFVESAKLHLVDYKLTPRLAIGNRVIRCAELVTTGSITAIIYSVLIAEVADKIEIRIRTFNAESGRQIDDIEVSTVVSTEEKWGRLVLHVGVLYFFLPDILNQIQFGTINTTTGAISSNTALTALPTYASTPAAADVSLDAVSLDTTIALSYVDLTTGQAVLANFKPAGPTTDFVLIPGATDVKRTSVFRWTGVDAAILLYDQPAAANRTVQIAVYDSGSPLVVVEAVTTLETETIVSGHVVVSLGGFRVGGVGPSNCFWTRLSGGVEISTSVRQVTFDSGATIGPLTTYKNRAQLAAKPFERNGSLTLFLLSPDTIAANSVLTTTLVLFDHTDNVPYAKVMPGRAAFRIGIGFLAAPVTSGAAVSLAVLRADELVVGATLAEAAPSTVSVQEVNWDTPKVHVPLEVEDFILIPGALPRQFDGQKVVEQGFIQQPGEFVVKDTAVGLILAGTYQYTYLFKHVDDRGVVHRSSPSPPVTVVLPNLRQTEMAAANYTMGLRQSITIEIYRTKDAKIIPFLLREVNVGPDQDTVSFANDNTPDGSLGTKILYTFGGTVPDTDVPAYMEAVAFKNRLMIVPLEDLASKIIYSRTRIAKEPYRFSGTLLQVAVPSDGGDIIAIADIADRLVIWKSGTILSTWGEGKNDRGLGRNFDPPREIETGVGCDSPTTLVRVPGRGVLFRSSGERSGFWVLGRKLTLSYAGAPSRFDAFKDTFSGAVSIDDLGIAVFLASAGISSLMYDWQSGEWSRWSIAGSSAVMVNGLMAHRTLGGVVLRESRTAWKDDTASYVPELITPIIYPGGAGMWARLHTVLIRGYNITAADIEVAFMHDELDAWTPIQVLNQSSGQFDWEVFLSTGDPGAALADKAMTLEVSPPFRKCEWFRMRIRSANLTGDERGFELTQLVALVSAVAVGKPIDVARKIT